MNKQEREPIGRFRSLDRKPLGLAETKERLAGVGVAVLIVGLDSSRNGDNESDPLIWTISELKSKFETDKVAGEISIPAETRKNGESVEDNVLGALTEFCDDTTFSLYVKKHVIRMDGKWYREKGIIVRERFVDVAVLIYDGALDFPLKPTCPEEVSPNGWVKKSELVMSSKLRDVSRQALDLDSRENLIRDALESYHRNPERKRQVFPETFDSMQKFSNKRNFGIDWEIVPQDYLKVWERVPEAHRLTLGAINLLVEAQNQKERDYKREDGIVLELKKAIKGMDYSDYAVGMSEIIGSEIRSVKVPKGWWKKNRKYRKFAKQAWNFEEPDVYALQTTAGNSVKKSWGSWGLHRGDSLGYPEELRKEWYLVFNERSSTKIASQYNYAIVPISGIRSLKLRPYDAYGF